MANNTNIIRIPSSIKTTFFKYWFEFLKPFHGMSPREYSVAAAFLKERFELAKVIKDEELLDKILLSDEGRKKIKADCGLSSVHFQKILQVFRDRKIIVDGVFNKKFIPNIGEDAKSFRLTLFFDLSDE